MNLVSLYVFLWANVQFFDRFERFEYQDITYLLYYTLLLVCGQYPQLVPHTRLVDQENQT